MAQTSLLVGTLIGSLLVGALVVLLGRGAKSYSLPQPIAGDGEQSLVARLAHSPGAWTAAFLLACVGFAGAALAFVGVVSLPEGTQAVVGAVLLAGGTLAFVFYLFYGTFASARGRGLENSHAAVLGSWAVGLLFVAAIALKLLGIV